MSRTGLDWLAQAKLGMFYHFGLYTLLGDNENAVRNAGKTEYRKLMERFKARRFDADAWVDCAVAMGARYIVPTAKHVEGFCLWDSQVTDLKTTNTPCGRDLIGELAKAAAKQNVKFAFYYNIDTWLNDGNDVWNHAGLRYHEFLEAQLTELLTNYGPVALIWFDSAHPEIDGGRLRRIVRLIKRLQPDCLVNDRGLDHRVPTPLLGDYVTPERGIPESNPGRRAPVECCDSMGVKSWGFHAQETFWSTAELARRVSLCASRGYNYLLNVEPAPDGSIRRECRVRAQALGRWIRNHQAALEAAPCDLAPRDPNELSEPPIGVATRAGNTLYLHLHRWPVADELLVRARGTPRGARLTDAPRVRLTTAAEDGGVLIRSLPHEPPAGASPWIAAIDFAAPPAALQASSARLRDVVAGESIVLSPPEAERSAANGVVLNGVNHWPSGNVSIGGIHKVGDAFSWRVRVPTAGEYEAYASLGAIASQSDAEFELSCGKSRLTGRTWFTGDYRVPERRSIGRLQLAKGSNRIVLRVTAVPKGHFPDVHGITLIPAVRLTRTNRRLQNAHGHGRIRMSARDRLKDS